MMQMIFQYLITFIFRIVSKSECWRCLVTKEDREEDNVDLRLDPGKILKILIKKYKSVTNIYIIS